MRRHASLCCVNIRYYAASIVFLVYLCKFLIAKLLSGKDRIIKLVIPTLASYKMSRPVRLTSASHLREIVQDYETTFIMFYSSRNASIQAFTPIYNSLCARYSTPSIAFTKTPREDFPELRDQCGVSQNSVLDLVVFKRGENVGVIEIKDSRSLERCIERYVRPRYEVRLQPCCDDKNTSADDQSRPQRRSSWERSPERHAPRLVPLRIDPRSAARVRPNQTMPANMTYRYPHRGHGHERPAELIYRGRDGRPRRASSVHITRDGHRPAEVTYLDRSGPLAIERAL